MNFFFSIQRVGTNQVRSQTRKYVCVCLCQCMCLSVSVYVCVCLCVCQCIQLWVHLCVCMCVCVGGGTQERVGNTLVLPYGLHTNIDCRNFTTLN